MTVGLYAQELIPRVDDPREKALRDAIYRAVRRLQVTRAEAAAATRQLEEPSTV